MKLKLPTFEQVASLISRDECEGICLACGAEASGIEPDAERYECEACGEEQVYGAEQLLILGYFRA